MRHNDVPEILFVTNATVATAGDVTALLPGQLGIFSEKTGKAVTAFDEPVFLAVGLDENGDGNTDNIRKSAGRNIQPGNVVYATRQDYVAPVDKVIDITDVKALCGDSFGIKVEARNEQIYAVQGTIQYRESFVAKADNCDACADDACSEANVAKLVQDIVLQSKLGEDPFFKVEATADMGEVGTPNVRVITAAELQTIVDATEALEDKSTQKKVGIRVTAIATKVQHFANVNLDYMTARQTDVFVTIVGDATAKVEVTTELQYEQNSGYDVRELEFQTIGFRTGNTGAYRIGAITQLPLEVDYESDLKKKYTIFTLAYDHKSRTGSWLQYDKPLATYIVVENTATEVATAVATQLGKFVANSTLLADDGNKTVG